MGTAVKHPVPARVKPSLIIFDIRALWHSALSVRVPGCQKLQMMAEPSLAQDALQLYLYGNSGRQVVSMYVTAVVLFLCEHSVLCRSSLMVCTSTVSATWNCCTWSPVRHMIIPVSASCLQECQCSAKTLQATWLTVTWAAWRSLIPLIWSVYCSRNIISSSKINNAFPCRVDLTQMSECLSSVSSVFSVNRFLTFPY